MWCYLTGVKPPPQKKAKLSETDAHYEEEKRKRELQKHGKTSDLGCSSHQMAR